MDASQYKTLFKRKSFHLFRGVGSETITEEELNAIKEAYDSFESLYPDIRTAIRIVPAKEVNFKRDAEYCILIYSEKKANFRMNVGYLGEQLDLYLVSKDIGTLWYGIGRTKEKSYDGMEFVIMIAIHKVSDQSKYRKDMFKAKRKPLHETWEGDTLGVAEIARFAPSACNLQPWYVMNEGEELTVYRYKKPGVRGMMPAAAVGNLSKIDVGIFLCFLEICLAEEKINYSRELFIDKAGDRDGYSKVAVYTLENK